ITADVDPSLTGTVTNTATVASSTTDPDETNNTGTADSGLAPSAALSVAKTVAEAEVVAGGTMTYQLAVRNDGSSTAADVVLTDELPAQVAALAVSDPRCEVTDGVLTCALGDLLPGAV